MTDHDHKQEIDIALEKLGDSKLTLSDPAEDIRGRKIVDRNGNDIGKVEALMIARGDDDEDTVAKVRFLQVGEGGFLGIGEHKVLIPVDVIQDIDRDTVHIDQTREHVANGPVYDPRTVLKQDYMGRLYEHYGQTPFWDSGYAYPSYPYYRATPHVPGGPSSPTSTTRPS